MSTPAPSSFTTTAGESGVFSSADSLLDKYIVTPAENAATSAATSAVSSAVKSTAGTLTINGGLVIVGVILALGALFIGQKKTVLKIGDGLAKGAALVS